MTNQANGLTAARELERVAEAAQDALTDEMISRMAETYSNTVDLLDQVNRAGLNRAIPVLAELVNNGDLERLVHLARVYGSAQDALTDEMVGRLAETMGEGLSLLDRMNRGGAARLVEMLERMEAAGTLQRMATVLPRLLDHLSTLEDLARCLDRAADEAKAAPPATGGAMGLWHLVKEKENQEALHFVFALGRQMRAICLRQTKP